MVAPNHVRNGTRRYVPVKGADPAYVRAMLCGNKIGCPTDPGFNAYSLEPKGEAGFRIATSVECLCRFQASLLELTSVPHFARQPLEVSFR